MSYETTNWINSLSVCQTGKCRIDPDANGRPVSVMHGRVHKIGEDARAYIDARPKLRDAFAQWWTWRNEEVNRWKHVTPHFRYNCDAGSLAVRVNGAKLMIGNGVGDGNFPVYIVRGDRIPPSFTPTVLSIDGSCKIEVLDYDCGGGNVLETIELSGEKSCAWFLRDDAGAVVVEVRNA